MPHFDWTQWGIAGAVICVLFFILWRILVWVMAWVDKQSEQHQKERSEWLTIMGDMKESINLHNQSSIEARRQQNEAHEYQRKEHEKMLTQMDEVTKTLGRINGYVDHK